MISIVSPVYNSETCLQKLVEKIIFNTKKFTNSIEIILVDDGSKDNSWSKIKQLKKKYKFIKGIKLNKNYGQHKAISIGIQMSTKNFIVVMDCDLEDNPKHIIEMHKLYKIKKKPVIIRHLYKNHNTKFRSISNIFWNLLKIISFKNFDPQLGNFILIDKKIKKKYLSLKLKTYFYGDLLTLNTKFQIITKIRNCSIRKQGTTYNFIKLLLMGLNLIKRYNLLSLYFSSSKKLDKEKIIISEKI